MGVEPKIGGVSPQIIHFNIGCFINYKPPSILGGKIPLFWKKQPVIQQITRVLVMNATNNQGQLVTVQVVVLGGSSHLVSG